MDSENDSGDQNGGDGQGSRAPRSVREGLGGGKGRKAHRSDRRGRLGREGQPGRPAPPPESSAQPGPTPPLTNRIPTRERAFEADGRQWTARVTGSSAVPGRSDASTRILELAFAEAGEGARQVGTAYLATPDLAEAPEEALVALLSRARRAPIREKRGSGKGSGGRGRRSKPRPRRSGPSS